jgi:hypothetical protein
MLAPDGGEVASERGEPLDPDWGGRRFGVEGNQSAPCVSDNFVDCLERF